MSVPVPYLDDGDVVLHLGDCVEVMAAMEPESVDAVVCDPPYGLGFMGKEWDADFTPADMPMRRNGAQDAVNAGAARQGGRQRAGEGYQRRIARDSRDFQKWCETWATEALRVLRPGGHLLAFGGTRTFHRLTCAIEDAGFEIRDDLLDLHAPPVEAFMASLDEGQRDAFLRLVSGSPLRAWLYGSGFPKSLDVSKAIDKAAGAEREVVGQRDRLDQSSKPCHRNGYSGPMRDQVDALDLTAPATPEAAAWQGWGTALKPAWEPVVVARKPLAGTVAACVLRHGTGALNVDGCRVGDNPGWAYPNGAGGTTFHGQERRTDAEVSTAGRWPANVVLDEEAAALLDAEVGERPGFASQRDLTARDGATVNAYGHGLGRLETGVREGFNDTGGPSRFFYTAKASSAERDGASHPTVKPLALMRWLVRLVTPPGGVVLDPFAGSGTTLLAAREEGLRAIGIEREAEYAQMAAHRLRQLSLLGGVA